MDIRSAGNRWWSARAQLGLLLLISALTLTGAAQGAAQRAADTDPPRPLILIPGTLGTYIGNDSVGVIWLNVYKLATSQSDSFLDDLELDQYGQDILPQYDPPRVLTNHGVGGLIGSVDACPIGSIPICEHVTDEYNVTVHLLEDRGYTYHGPGDETADQTLFVFPYDWRKSMVLNAQLLRAKIKHVLALTGASSVDVLAHSQGGVVTNFYLHAFGQEREVHRVVTLGTPYLGTPKFLGVLEFKEPCEVVHGTACVLNRAEAAKLVRNFPGSLELLPSRRYWEVAASPLVERVRFADGSSVREVESYDGMLSRLRASGKNMILIGQADELHSTMDVFPADSTPILRIAGVGLPTIGTIEEEAYQDCVRTPIGFQTYVTCTWKTRIKNHYSSGDGTVVRQSAEVENCRTGTSLDTSDFAHVAQRVFVSHDGLAHDAGTIDAAVSFFANGLVPPAPCPSAQTAALRRLADVGDTGLSGTELRTTGPLVGSITDGVAVTGTTDPVTETAEVGIPGSNFAPSDGGSDYFTTADATLHGSFTATADGQVSLELRTYADDAVAALAVSPPITVQQGAIVSIDYGQPEDLSVAQLSVDDNADGVVDRTIPFEQPVGGDVAEADTTPPTSSVQVEHYLGPAGEKLARVTVTAADEGGSGIGEIHYWTTTGLEGSYTEPLVLPAQGDIEVVATDRAGNVQVDPAWGVLDDHTGVNFLVTDFASPHFNEPGFLDYPGDVDYWGVHSDGGRLQVQLVGLTFDGNLELDNLDGSAIASSTHSGDRSEKIDVTLPAGNYLIKVTGAGAAYDADHPYRLNVNALGGGS